MIIIGKPINGISINGLEYLLDDSGEEMKFGTTGEAKRFLTNAGITDFEDFVFQKI